MLKSWSSMIRSRFRVTGTKVGSQKRKKSMQYWRGGYVFVDAQSWYHSQESNIMIDSPAVCKEWTDGLRSK